MSAAGPLPRRSHRSSQSEGDPTRAAGPLPRRSHRSSQSEGDPTRADTRTIRVVLAKPGLDGHDQGAKVVARAMLDAGFDVLYTGLRQTPGQVVAAALKHNADVIALSSMAGSHLPFCTRLKPMLEEAGLDDRLWIIGGNLPAQDHDALRALGFSGVFQTGSRLDDICDFIRKEAA